MVYTCYEMIRDCRENRPEGWSYFVPNYVPVVQKLVRRYGPGDSVLEGVLLAIHSPSNLFASLDPAPERVFVAALRQQVLEILDKIAPAAQPDIALDLETLTAALDSLTLVEKQAVWLETMRYTAAETATLLRTSVATIQKIRDKAGESIRAKTDGWSITLLAGNGRELGRLAAPDTPQCLPVKAFLDVIDGRTTWRGREEMDRHVNGCWHCIDHFCRMVEVVELLRRLQPLSEAEAEPFRKLWGLAAEKRPAWKRLFGAG